jgi:hypothetical protein
MVALPRLYQEPRCQVGQEVTNAVLYSDEAREGNRKRERFLKTRPATPVSMLTARGFRPKFQADERPAA